MIRPFICEDCGTECQQDGSGTYRTRCIICQNKYNYRETEKKRITRLKKRKETKKKYIKLRNGLEVRNDILGRTMVRDD